MTGFAELRDPAAIARARAELDKAALRARDDAAAAKQQALENAARAEKAAMDAEVVASLGPAEPVLAARDAVTLAKQRHAEAVAEAEQAQRDVEAASEVVPQLVQRQVAGEAISRDDVLAAHAAVTEAGQVASFRAVVANRLLPLIAEAEAAHKAAVVAEHEPVLQRGVDLRIEAGIDADAARTPMGRDAEKIQAALKLFERGNSLIRFAAERGCIVRATDGLSLYWPTSERSERRRWKREA